MSKRKAMLLIEAAKQAQGTFSNQQFTEMYIKAIEDKELRKDSTLFNFMKGLERAPVDIETFLDSPEFFGSTDINLWPEVRKSIIEINQYWWDDARAYKEVILAGPTRSGKTFRSIITLCYRFYLLTCLKNPQKTFNTSAAKTILIPIFAAKPQVTKREVYGPMRKYIEQMPYFQKNCLPNPLIESEMIFNTKNIHITPVGADIDAILGSDTIGGMIDEINFMQVILKSKKSEVTTGRSGTFDQAKTTYETLDRRKRGTFPLKGPQIGIIILSSSTRYKGDFTDKRVETVKEYGYKDVYVHNKPRWEIRPSSEFCGEKFKVLVGNEMLNDTRIIADEEKFPEGSYVLEIPVEYKREFETNIDDALRDVAGISTSAISPFIKKRYKILEAIQMGQENGLESFLVKDNVVLGIDGMPMVKKGHFCKNPSRPRYVHIDLAHTGDSCGIAMIRFDGMKEVPRGDAGSELLPLVSIELACTIKPDHNNEINFAEVRSWVKMLKDLYGYPIRAVSYDGIFSIESIQQWKKQGMKSGHQSVDKTSAPYKQLRDAFTDGRVLMYQQDVLVDELFDLEYDEKKDRIDHPIHSSKDCADAVAGSYATLITRRASWTSAVIDDEAHRDSLRAQYDERHNEPRPD